MDNRRNSMAEENVRFRIASKKALDEVHSQELTHRLLKDLHVLKIKNGEIRTTDPYKYLNDPNFTILNRDEYDQE